MAAVYSTRLLAQHDAELASPAEYTVPVAKLVVLRCIDLYSGVLTGNFALAELPGSPDVVFFQASWAAREIGWRPWRGREVFYAGDTIRIFGNQPIDVFASGYIFDA